MVTTSKITTITATNALKGPASQTKKSAEKFNAQDLSKTAPTGETYQTFSVTALASLFFDDQPREHKSQQAITYGNELLDQLEKIRIGLISGRVPEEELVQLVKALKNRPALSFEPELENLILEIETRAAVELAKLGI